MQKKKAARKALSRKCDFVCVCVCESAMQANNTAMQKRSTEIFSFFLSALQSERRSAKKKKMQHFFSFRAFKKPA
jgi:hypothetical protein